jgi:hypothetical protein
MIEEEPDDDEHRGDPKKPRNSVFHIASIVGAHGALAVVER